MRDRLFAAALIVLLFGAALLGAQPQPPRAASNSVRDDGFGGLHAWYELEAAERVRVTRFARRHDTLDHSVTRLVVAWPGPGAPATWGTLDGDSLSRWVRRGGTAVIVGDVPVVRGAKDAVPKLVPARAAGAGTLRGPWSVWVRTLPARPGSRLRLPRGTMLFPHAGWRVLLADSAGALVVERPYASGGRELLVAGAEPLQNRHLRDGDGARLALLIGGRRGALAFDEALHGELAERPWYRALDVPERLACAIAACAGLLWLWGGLFPLGPPLRAFEAREPTSAEYLDAVARLYERARVRAHAAGVLLADARRSLRRVGAGPERALLDARLDAAAALPVRDEAALLTIARLARTAREDPRS